jgi:hypothetical protein
MGNERGRGGARRRSRWAAIVGAGGIALVAVATTGCLGATPPKTPNQRAVERDAPPVAVPPPPDAGRTPRPAAMP